MSQKVYHGDEWKNADSKTTSRTREAKQAWVNTEYANGRMELSEWRRRTDELSDPTKWTIQGRVL